MKQLHLRCDRRYFSKIEKDYISNSISEALFRIFWRLYDAFGPQHWWPGLTPLEVAVGAILTQNTSWKNVEKAIANLKGRGLLSSNAIWQMPVDSLAVFLRPAGYYNVKAKRLKNFIDFLVEEFGGEMESMAEQDESIVRERLLAINGIGPETADSILLYALGKPCFVIDAYTIRILLRHDLVDESVDYHAARALFMENLPADTCLFNEFHALFVKTGKELCRRKGPRCSDCPLTDL